MAPATDSGGKLLDQDGSVLVAVLWALFFLAGLALVVNTVITPQMSAAARFKDQAVLPYLAQAAVKRGMIELREDKTLDADALSESWSQGEEIFNNVDMGGNGTFSLIARREQSQETPAEAQDARERYGLADEEGKINLNLASEETLKRFFETAGRLATQDAADLAAAVADWRDPDDESLPNGAESAYYAALEPAYPCKNSDFEVLEELLLVRGADAVLFEKVQPYLTVYGKGIVNINTAGEVVLESLGLTRSLIDKVLGYRQGGDGIEGTEDDDVFSNAGAIFDTINSKAGLTPSQSEELQRVLGEGRLGVRSDHFSGIARVKGPAGIASREISFVLNREEQILYWQEH